ncbi:MAG: alpha-L-fucosidase, partial [Bacteroidales bacterium]|nr:alpha-L-fucosidase [Bacteroidales bacterium]
AIRKLQPQAVTAIMGNDVRWVGNEGGLGRKTEWSVNAFGPVSEDGALEQREQLGLTEMSADMGSREIIAQAKQLYWYPSEVDVSIRPGWFYHAEQDLQVRSLNNLIDIYYQSVGRNSVLLLNIPPDRRGLLHENDVERLHEFRSTLDEIFDRNLVDPLKKTWKAESGDSMVFDVNGEDMFGTFLISEDISKGQRVESFTVEAFKDGEWELIAEGSTIGYRRLLRFEKTQAEQIRVTITSTRATANISAVGLY